MLNSPCCVRKGNMDRTHTLLNLFLLFCLLRSASSSSSCSSSSVPFTITARIGEGGASREYRLLWIDVRCAGTLYCEQRYASIGVAQCHARTPRWLERNIVNPPLERTSSVPLIAQRTHSSVRFGTHRFSAVRGAVRYGGCDMRIQTRDRSRTGSRTAQQHVASLFVEVS